MSDGTDFQNGQPTRCPYWDSVIDPGDERCLMCWETWGQVVSAGSSAEPYDTVGSDTKTDEPTLASEDQKSRQINDESDLKEESVDHGVPGTIESIMVERQSRITLLLAFVAFIIIGFIAAVILRFPASGGISFTPTETALPPTITFTPSWTPLPSGQGLPTSSATVTPVPLPSDTPQPPRIHSVSSGDTLFGLGLRYGVSHESIAAANSLAPDVGLLVSQQLAIPWPTATPPLVPVAVEVSGQTIIADPTDCSLYEIKSGDTLLGVASRNRVDYRALLAVNRLTELSILQPGDEICIPRIIRSGVLPLTPGPSPTPTNTPPPEGPNLLLPLADSRFGSTEKAIVLQWVAVKDLEENEWYMVEMTDLTDVDSHPLRAFVRQTSFRVPGEWRPDVEETHQFRWRVAIVKVTGQREDGQFIYTFGGTSSEEGSFYWHGAVPTATPPIPTETPTPSNGNNGY